LKIKYLKQFSYLLINNSSLLFIKINLFSKKKTNINRKRFERVPLSDLCERYKTNKGVLIPVAHSDHLQPYSLIIYYKNQYFKIVCTLYMDEIICFPFSMPTNTSAQNTTNQMSVIAYSVYLINQ
jgi:hypothetical protein